ncbi:helix-turn-helix domain-containing protein [Nocardioides sp. NBC_00368]|uniref:tetratricopeptide repeat protein n=1 Tax=Nocardioides sp. NBC_00368 TaxID=2976000 RepID=UPI002E208AA6
MIGNALVELRRRAGLTQEALAERAGISVRGLRKLESGLVAGPRLATLEVLADALELTGDARSAFVSGSGLSEGRGSVERAIHIPRQLPPRLASFVGRAGEVEILDDAVAGATTSPAAASTCVVTMAGLPGIGKTALAVEWGYRAASHFPDGQLYLNLRGFDAKNEPLSPDEALRVLLTSLGVAEAKICHGLEARIGQYRTLVSTKRILVILDNAVDSDQVRPLLPAGMGSAALVVSRHRLPGLVAEVGAVPVTVGVLRPEESRELILRRLPSDARTGDAQPLELQPLVDMCSGLPLALALVASRAQLEPEMIGEYATMARPADQRFSVFASSDRSASFEDLLLGSLDSLSEDVQRCFVLMGLGVSSELSLAELASLCACGLDEARRLAGELLDASLVQAAGGGRIALHDLIWDFVTERARSGIPPDEVSRCRKRLLDYLIQGSVAATAQFAPYRTRRALPAPAEGIVVEEFGSANEARAWMSSMLGAGVVAVGHAEAWGFPREAAWLADGLGAYLDIQGRWDELLAVATSALRAGEVLGDSQTQALAHRSLAIAQARTGDAEQAEQSVRRALSLYSRSGDVEGEAYAHRLLGHLLDESGDQRNALDHHRQALVLFEELGDEAAQARALNGVGWIHAQLGDLEIALDHCTRSAEMAVLLMHTRSAASAWDSIGFIRHAMRDFEASEDAYQRALAAWRDIDERYYQARTLERLGRLRVDMADHAGAIDAMRLAEELFDELGLPQADAVRKRLTGLERVGVAPPERR